jgi:D-amino-acid dehydrogenase
MFTLSEMDNYNCRSVHADMNSLFSRNIAELGWNIHHAGSLSQTDRTWISDYESIPPWLAESFNEDIFALNRESGAIWDNWIKSDPSLFENSLIKQGILRIYSDAEKFELAVARQDSIGATLSVLNGDDIVRDQPALASAVAGGHIAGGINVVGFTINAHKFMRHLIASLEARGVRMQWNRRARQLVMDENGHVAGIRFSDGMIAAENIVVSPGAYCDELLRGTRSHGKIGGIIGAWLRLPNLHGTLRNSLKLSRKNHITEDSNITVATDGDGQPILIIGSGYGYTGSDVTNIDPRLLRMMYEGLIDTAQNYFPEAYEVALSTGELENGLKYCVRPWTASSLGVFEIIPTSRSGYCIVTGGHNTGGFTQAPVCGKAVVASLRGEEHAMHAHYHPDRCSEFLRPDEHEPAALRYG